MARIGNGQFGRRDFLKLSAAGVLGGSASGWFNLLAQEAARAAATGTRHKACILLWMEGGPSQQHTFDLKEGGDYRAIPTAVPGTHISEYLPQLAQQTKQLALLRGMSTGETVHSRARFLLHTGYRQIGSEAFPTLGSIAAAELGQPSFDLPNFVCIDAGTDGNNGPGSYRPAPGYLGAQHAPLMITDLSQGIPNLQPAVDASAFADQAALLEAAEKQFLERYGIPAAEAHRTSHLQAMRLMRSDQLKAFEIEREPKAVRDRYGPSKFGQSCLLARRLVQTGVPFVEVILRGWDDHSDAAVHIKRRSAYVDPAMAGLIADLQERGLLETTLVIWMGEFGRSPGGARNHFARAWTTVLAGAGLKTGQVIGRTDDKGAEVVDRPISVPDFMATVCSALGIDYKKRYESAGGRPVRIVDQGAKPIAELLP
jgi:uncharacterized protein (DUF1501 family)